MQALRTRYTAAAVRCHSVDRSREPCNAALFQIPHSLNRDRCFRAYCVYVEAERSYGACVTVTAIRS
jgi:hypothetical protein